MRVLVSFRAGSRRQRSNEQSGNVNLDARFYKRFTVNPSLSFSNAKDLRKLSNDVEMIDKRMHSWRRRRCIKTP